VVSCKNSGANRRANRRVFVRNVIGDSAREHYFSRSLSRAFESKMGSRTLKKLPTGAFHCKEEAPELFRHRTLSGFHDIEKGGASS